MPVDNAEARVARGMESLLSGIAAGDWERARDAVPFWDDERAERDEPVRFVEVMGLGVCDALDLARDANNQLDTCHVSIVWPGRGTTVRFRFVESRWTGCCLAWALREPSVACDLG